MSRRHSSFGTIARLAVLALVAASALGGCGGSAPDRPEQDAVLVLHAKPSAVHAGIALAVARDFDGAEGVHLRLRVPASSGRPADLLATGKAGLAILDIHDLARARERGRDLVGVMALLQRPVPAVRPGRLRRLHIDDAGAPPYPELLLCVTRATLTEQPGVVRATVAALRRGYGEAIADPESAVGALVDRYSTLDRATVQRAFDRISPAFTEGATTFGELRPAALRAWARWEAAGGITRRPPDVARAFSPPA